MVKHSQIVPDLQVRDATMVYDAVVTVLKIVCVNRLKCSTPWDCAKVRKTFHANQSIFAIA